MSAAEPLTPEEMAWPERVEETRTLATTKALLIRELADVRAAKPDP